MEQNKPMPSSLYKLGLRIRSERIRKGLSQTELANIIGQDQPNLSRIEQGRVNPGYLVLLEIAKGLDIDLKDLV